MTKQTQNILVVALLLVITIVLYFNSLWGIFLFDDGHSIQDNLFIKSARYIPYFFKGYYTSAPYIPRGMFRPLLLLTFSFNYYFSGMSPLGYHIINMVLHFLNGILLFYFLSIVSRASALPVTPVNNEKMRQSFPYGLCVLISLIFLAHPLNTEAVCYISSRSDLLAYTFVFSGLICYHQGRRIAAVCLYALGLLSKETALVLPLLAFSYDIVCRPEQFRDKITIKTRLVPFYLMIGLLTCLYLVYRSIILNFGAEYTFTAPFTSHVRSVQSNFAIQAIISFFYLKMFFFPFPLTIHHIFPEFPSLLAPAPLAAICGIVVLLMIAWLIRKKRPLVSLGIIWYFICLLPKFYATLHIVAAEHHFYLASFGIYLILADLIFDAYVKFRRKFLIITTGIVCIFTILVWTRNADYRSEYAFWRSTLRSDPGSAVAHHNIGLVYVERGDYKAAEEEFKKTLELAPSYGNQIKKNSRENLANINRLQKKFNEAIVLFNENIALGVDNFSTYQNLGVVYSDMGNDEQAEKMWQKGLSLFPYASGIHVNLGLLSLRRNNLVDAKKYFQAAIISDPDMGLAYFGLGEVAEKESKSDLAIESYEKTTMLNPDYVLAYYQLSKLYFNKKDYRRAVYALEQVVKLNPYLAVAHNNLAILYLSLNPPQVEGAIAHLKKAVFLGFPVKEELLKLVNINPQ